MSSCTQIQSFNFRNEITPATKIYFRSVFFSHSIPGLSVSISPAEKCNRVFRNKSCLQLHRFPLSLAVAASLLYLRYQSLPNRNRILKNETYIYSTDTPTPSLKKFAVQIDESTTETPLNSLAGRTY